MLETVVIGLATYTLGLATPLAVEWHRTRRHHRRVRAITSRWIENSGSIAIHYLLRDVGLATSDLGLLFKADLLHGVHQLQEGPSKEHLGITDKLIDLADDMTGRQRKNTASDS